MGTPLSSASTSFVFFESNFDFDGFFGIALLVTNRTKGGDLGVVLPGRHK